MLVAEQLFLLLRRDDGRAEIGSGFEGYGLVGAVLSDLVAAGHLALGDEEKDPTVRVTTSGPVGHPVLDTALERIRSKEGKRLSSVVLDNRLRPMDTIPASLVSAGVITIEPKRFGGLVPARYPVRDPAPERALRERLRAVLAGATAQPNEAALLALLKGMGVAGHILKEEKGAMSRTGVDRRVDEVSSSALVGTLVGRTIEQLQAAVMIAGGS